MRQCLWAAADGRGVPDWEFQTLIGFDRDEVRHIAQAWPSWDDADDQKAAVNNVLNNLLGYPHDCSNRWTDYISVTEAEASQVFSRFRSASSK